MMRQFSNLNVRFLASAAVLGMLLPTALPAQAAPIPVSYTHLRAHET